MAKSNDQTFTQKNKQADKSERFVYEHINQILPDHYYAKKERRFKDEHIKGADMGFWLLKGTDKKQQWQSLLAQCPHLNINTDNLQPLHCVQKGTCQVKTARWEPGTARDDSTVTDTIQIGFQIREKQEDQKSQPGWLRALFYPEKANEYAETNTNAHKAIESILLIFLLQRPWYVAPNDEYEPHKYYVAICFTDIEALKKRLFEYMPKEWDLNDPLTISKYPKEKKYYENGTYLQCNQWYVPLTYLEDLATVTMINESPALKKKMNGVDKEILEKRINHLKRLANGRHFNSDDSTEQIDRDAEIKVGLTREAMNLFGADVICRGEEIIIPE